MFIRCLIRSFRFEGKILRVGETLEVTQEQIDSLEKLVKARMISVHQTDPAAGRVRRRVERAPTPPKKPAPVEKPERARDEDGHFKADDPSTPDTNEAWVGGTAPQNLSRMKKSELTSLAEELGVSVDRGDTKSMIIKKIEEKQG